MIRVWRISAAAYADRIFSGEGAFRRGGRWNSPGRAVVYMSQSLSLSVLELMVHMIKPHMLRGYKRVWVDVPDELVTSVDVERLPDDWRAVPVQASTRAIGDQWFDSHASAVLQVPSTVVPEESNYVLNPSHPEYKALTVGDLLEFVFDARLLLS